MSAAPALATQLRRAAGGGLVVGPDEESESWVRAIAQEAQALWIVGTKERCGDHRVQIHFPTLPSSSHAIIIDDIVSSGGTQAVAARALYRQGVTVVDALVVHALFAPGATRCYGPTGNLMSEVKYPVWVLTLVARGQLSATYPTSLEDRVARFA